MKSRHLLCAAFFVCLATAAAAEEARAERPVLLDRIVAVVNEKTIYRSDVVTRARPFAAQLKSAKKPGADDSEERKKLYREVLDSMIEEMIVDAEAERLHITATADEVDRAMDEVAKVNKMTRQQLLAEVKKQGMTMDEYRAEVRRQLLDAKWTMLRIRSRIPAPTTGTEVEKDQARVALTAIERKKELSALRARAFVEVRW